MTNDDAESEMAPRQRQQQGNKGAPSGAFCLLHLVIEIRQAIFTHSDYLLTYSVVYVPMRAGRVLPLGLFFKNVISSSTKAEARYVTLFKQSRLAAPTARLNCQAPGAVVWHAQRPKAMSISVSNMGTYKP
jgi:hypothetical protein